MGSKTSAPCFETKHFIKAINERHQTYLREKFLEDHFRKYRWFVGLSKNYKNKISSGRHFRTGKPLNPTTIKSYKSMHKSYRESAANIKALIRILVAVGIDGRPNARIAHRYKAEIDAFSESYPANFMQLLKIASGDLSGMLMVEWCAGRKEVLRAFSEGDPPPCDLECPHMDFCPMTAAERFKLGIKVVRGGRRVPANFVPLRPLEANRACAQLRVV